MTVSCSSACIAPKSSSPIMRLEDILRCYEPGRTVLDIAHLAIYTGEILGISGHNGSGKSTLLRLLALLEPPDAGTLFFDGQPARTGHLCQRRQVTLLLQTPYLLSRSVAANVGYGLTVRGSADRTKRIVHALQVVGLDPALFLHRGRHELSGGERQRVALAARLVLEPRVLLMDEPTASVDEQSAALIATAARTAAANGSAVVIVSHDRDWITPLADRVINMRLGKIEAPTNGNLL